MKRYTHLTSEQRYQISNGLKEGYSQQAIADIIGVNQSTISREIRRNGPSRGRVKRRTARAGAYRPPLHAGRLRDDGVLVLVSAVSGLTGRRRLGRVFATSGTRYDG